MDGFYFQNSNKFELLLSRYSNKEIKIYIKDLNKKLNKSKKNKKLNKNNELKELLIKELEDESNQKKIIKKLKNKILKSPKNIINYYKKALHFGTKKLINEDITDKQIKEYLLDYIKLKYNEESILNLDIYLIFFKNKNALNEEGAREYVINKMENNEYCVIL